MFKREFYLLAIAAEKIGCTTDDLIYLGAREKLDIYALPGSFRMLSCFKTDHSKSDLVVDPPFPLKIDSESIRHLEAGNIELPIKIDKLGGIYYKDFFEKYNLPEEQTEDWFLHDDKLQTYAVTHTDYNKELAIKDCKLIVLETDLDILSNDSDAQKSVTPHLNQSKKLQTLIAASEHFWKNADRNEKDTQPTNELVENWLKKQGFSDINAKQGAVIIRPEWAVKGRR